MIDKLSIIQNFKRADIEEMFNELPYTQGDDAYPLPKSVKDKHFSFFVEDNLVYKKNNTYGFWYVRLNFDFRIVKHDTGEIMIRWESDIHNTHVLEIVEALVEITPKYSVRNLPYNFKHMLGLSNKDVGYGKNIGDPGTFSISYEDNGVHINHMHFFRWTESHTTFLV
jgi:hypothetical protein